MSISVYICPCQSGGAQAKEICRLFNLFADDRVELSNDINRCDVILVTDITSYRVLGSILGQKKLTGHWGKVIAFGEMDYPPKQFPCLGPSVTAGLLPGATLPYYCLMQAMETRFGWHNPASPAQRSLLFSFQGRVCNKLRSNLIATFGNNDNDQWLVTDTGSSFPVFRWRSVSDKQLLAQREVYLETLRNSTFGEKAFYNRLVDGISFVYNSMDTSRIVPIAKLKFYSYCDDIRRFMRQRKRDLIHIVRKCGKAS